MKLGNLKYTALAITTPQYKKFGPASSTPDFVLPAASKTYTICNPSAKSIVSDATTGATEVLYVSSGTTPIVGRPITLLTPFEFSYTANQIPTFYIHCVQDVTFYVEEGSGTGTVATGLLTFGSNPVVDQKVTIGTDEYVYKASVTTTAKQVLRGTTKEISIQNLMNAVHVIRPLVGYGSLTARHTLVMAYAITNTLFVTAQVGGSGGNSIATTTDVTGATWSAGTLLGGS